MQRVLYVKNHHYLTVQTTDIVGKLTSTNTEIHSCPPYAFERNIFILLHSGF